VAVEPQKTISRGTEQSSRQTHARVPRFDRHFFAGTARISRLGEGSLGGKASSLVRVDQAILPGLGDQAFPGWEVCVPTMVVLGTDLFDQFLDHNGLRELALSDLPDDRIAHAFVQAVLPTLQLGDLRALANEVRTPLAIRSSSLLEDALEHPFAGVYATKMIPNNAVSADARFRALTEAIKLVWASAFFRAPKAYARSIGQDIEQEKMAVLVQEVAGSRRGDRFYPTVSGVARSWNYYPTGPAEPEQGLLSLALGLGRTIVDGGVAWTISPAFPARPMPFGSTNELLKGTQTRFWAVNMGRSERDPLRETEFMVQPDLGAAEYDDVLRWTASTVDPRSGRLCPGVGRDGPRALNFAPILDMPGLPLVDLVKRLLALSEEELGGPVEIEFAVDLDQRKGVPATFSFLQVRPMAVNDASVDLDEAEMTGDDVLLASRQVLGNGVIEDIRDVVFVDPETFDPAQTPTMADEVEAADLRLQGKPYLLIGFGRWGSSDNWLGIPVDWSRIAGARVIVEASLPGMSPDPSQGSHFFQNLIAFGTVYLTVRYASTAIDWAQLRSAEAVEFGRFVHHVRLERPLRIVADGRQSRAVVRST
jgi:hypothetical protein